MNECGKLIPGRQASYCVLRKNHSGPCGALTRPAFHENTISFGPCAGPVTPDKGESWFCQGFGLETFDPSEPFALTTVILCGPCASMREAKVIQENVLSILDEIGAGK